MFHVSILLSQGTFYWIALLRLDIAIFSTVHLAFFSKYHEKPQMKEMKWVKKKVFHLFYVCPPGYPVYLWLIFLMYGRELPSKNSRFFMESKTFFLSFNG